MEFEKARTNESSAEGQNQGYGGQRWKPDLRGGCEKVMDLEPELYEKAEAERILLYKPNTTLTVLGKFFIRWESALYGSKS
jgi:hypothetical protein